MRNNKLLHLLNDKTRLGSLMLLFFSMAYLNLSFSVPIDTTFGDEVFTSRTLPMALSVTSILCALIQLTTPIFSGRTATRNAANHARESEPFFDESRSNWQQVLGLIGLMFFYSLSFSWFGFFLAGVLFLMAGFRLLGERRYLFSAFVAVALVGGLWAVLTQLFGLYLDSGEFYSVLAGS